MGAVAQWQSIGMGGSQGPWVQLPAAPPSFLLFSHFKGLRSLIRLGLISLQTKLRNWSLTIGLPAQILLRLSRTQIVTI